MATQVRMSKLSPTMETGTINRWLVKEGDDVSSGDTLAEVETDKASMPLETFENGKILKILAAEGKTVKVDEAIAVLGKAGEDISAMLGTAVAKSPVTAPPKTEVADPAENPEPKAPAAQPEQPPQQPAAPKPPTSDAPPQQKPPESNGGRLKASPLAKRLARERGIDLESLHPSGPGGRIVERDIPMKPKPKAPGAGAPDLSRAPSTPQGQDIPLSNVRQTIARRLSQSKQEIPHWYLFADMRVERLLELRNDLNADSEESGVKISINDLMVKITAAALKRHPEVNASFHGGGIL